MSGTLVIIVAEVNTIKSMIQAPGNERLITQHCGFILELCKELAAEEDAEKHVDPDVLFADLEGEIEKVKAAVGNMTER